jgi:DNA polymerase mu
MIPQLPDVNEYLVFSTKSQSEILPDSSESESQGDLPRKRRKVTHNSGGEELADLEMWDEDIELEDVPRFCIERPSPLVCVNQELVCLHDL